MLDNTGVTGKYVSSEGKEGDAVWSTRAKWTLLGGTIDGEPVTLAILDHPSNVGYPTHWHARGYGLFAANPLGDKQFNEPKAFDYTLRAGRVGHLQVSRADPRRRRRRPIASSASRRRSRRDGSSSR